MKRFSALCLAVLMALCLAACGSAARSRQRLCHPGGIRPTRRLARCSRHRTAHCHHLQGDSPLSERRRPGHGAQL